MNEPEQHEPTPKAPAIDEFITAVLGVSRREVINRNKCVACRYPDLYFRDEVSKKEYRICGLCQRCQDRIYKRKNKDHE